MERYCNGKLKGRDERTEYNGTGSTIASINTNALFFLFFSDIAAATFPPTLDYSHRIRYIDN